MAPCPSVALISSNSSYSAATARGFKSLSHIFYPFLKHEIAYREPASNQQIKCNVELDIRDISNDGYLLSLSVLPHVLMQALKECNKVNDAISLFRSVLNRWAEPSDYESFGAYLACIFVVSTADENPLIELSKMIQTQQTLHNSTSSKLVVPPYCCAPKWITDHSKTLKHYILLHDETISTDNDRCEEIFKQMCSTYGQSNCQILGFRKPDESLVNSTKWSKIDKLYDVLNKGLDCAMNDASPVPPPRNDRVETPTSSVSTISSVFPSVSVSPNVPRSDPSRPSWEESEKLITEDDGEECTKILKQFMEKNLIPYIEKELKSLYDLVGNRRGIIGKSITSGMKKWFTAGTSQSSFINNATYSWDSSEMQIRRLADLSFLFGNYSLAYQQYRGLKKDFENDQAMIAHALCSEMCAVALHTAQPNLNSKQFPIHYLESAMGFLLQHSAKFPYVMRCAFNSTDVLSDIEAYKEAAQICSKLVSLEGDHLVAVSQAKTADMFDYARMHRKSSFFRVLAANRFSNANISAIAFDCYKQALLSLPDKHWGVLDEHLSVKLLEEAEKAGVLDTDMTMECIRRLVKVCPKLHPHSQFERINTIVKILKSHTKRDSPVVLEIPNIDTKSVRIVYGERPSWCEIDDMHDCNVSNDDWLMLERCAHYSLFGPTVPFKGVKLVSDSFTDNLKPCETPSGERFRVILDLENPLSIPFQMNNVQLSVTDIVTDDKSEANPFELGVLNNLTINSNEVEKIELYIFPRKGCKSFRVDGILFCLNGMNNDGNHINVKIPLEIRGVRLNKTSKQQKSKMYSVDERLKAIVSNNTWPLLEFRIIKGPNDLNYCGQALRYIIEVENIGKEDVLSMTMATDGIDRVSTGTIYNEVRNAISSKVAVNSQRLCSFDFSGNTFLSVGEKKTIFVDVRAGKNESSYNFQDEKDSSSKTLLLFAYRGANGAMREWRKIVECERKKIVETVPSPIDENDGIFSLKILNCVMLNDVALSRIEIIRLRCSDDANFGIEILENKKIEIESEQSDTIIVRKSNEGASEIWTSIIDKELVPKWSTPRCFPGSKNDTEVVNIPTIGVTWKANVANNDGLVSTIYGEIFFDDPFFIKRDEIKNDRFEGHHTSKISKLVVSCNSEKRVTHDFCSSPICEFAIRINVRNVESKPADVSIRYIAKVREAIEGVHLVPHELRQQMWVDRPVRKVKIGASEEKTVEMKVRVTQASVYDIGGSNLLVEAKFDDNDDPVSYKIPSILTVVEAI